MKRPPYGLHLHCEYVRSRDGDTTVIRLPGSSHEWNIRLIDCWVDDKNKDVNERATIYADRVMQNAKKVSVLIPEPKYIVNLLKNLTFDRIPGHIYIDDCTTLNEVMVESGLATKTKPKKPKKGVSDAR